MKIDNKNDIYKYTPDEIYDYICELKEQLENASNNYTKYIQERDNKIDMAIEYLKTNGYGYDCCGDMCYFLDEENQKELLDILKDSDVNG